MVDKCSSPTPKWQCLTAWNPWLWAPSEMTTGCYETSLLLFANARGAGTLLTVKFLAPGIHRETNARGDARGWNWLAHNISCDTVEVMQSTWMWRYLERNLSNIVCGGVCEAGTVGKISDYQLEVPGSIPGLVEGWILSDLLSPLRPWTGTL